MNLQAWESWLDRYKPERGARRARCSSRLMAIGSSRVCAKQLQKRLITFTQRLYL
jgi:hypothetical protein